MCGGAAAALAHLRTSVCEGSIGRGRIAREPNSTGGWQRTAPPPELGGLLEPLVRIARDVFPAWLLAPLRQPGFMTDSTPSLRLVGDLGDHPATAEFRDRLAADELSDLFKSDPPTMFSPSPPAPELRLGSICWCPRYSAPPRCAPG
jgi:hypothetical protein